MPMCIKDCFNISKHILSTVCRNIYKNTTLAHMALHAFKHRMPQDLTCPSTLRSAFTHQHAHCLQHGVTSTTVGTPIHGFPKVEQPFTASGSKHIWLNHRIAFGSGTLCLQHVITSTTGGAPTHGFTCSQTQDLKGTHLPQCSKACCCTSKCTLSATCGNYYNKWYAYTWPYMRPKKHRASQDLTCPSTLRSAFAHQHAHCSQHEVTSTAGGTPIHGFTCSQTQDVIGPHMP